MELFHTRESFVIISFPISSIEERMFHRLSLFVGMVELSVMYRQIGDGKRPRLGCQPNTVNGAGL